MIARSEEDGEYLEVTINDEGIINGGHGSSYLINLFVSVLVGRHVQEGSDHGAIRLMHILYKERTVEGLMQVDQFPALKVCQSLARRILETWAQSTGTELKKNFWRDAVPKSWLELSMEKKLEVANAHLLEVCKMFALQEDVKVVTILNDTRFVLDYRQSLTHPNFGWAMIKVERELRRMTQMEVELQLESLEDKNKRVQRSGRST